MIYLASPYSHPDPAVVETRYCETLRCVAELTMFSTAVYSPIAHWHEIARRFSLPTDAAFWGWQNKSMLELCSSVAVLKLPGWEISIGVTKEIAWAKELSKPISYIEPDYPKLLS